MDVKQEGIHSYEITTAGTHTNYYNIVDFQMRNLEGIVTRYANSNIWSGMKFNRGKLETLFRRTYATGDKSAVELRDSGVATAQAILAFVRTILERKGLPVVEYRDEFEANLR